MKRLFAQVTIVRPYGPKIREQVFALLRRAHIDVEHATVIPRGTPDDEVIRLLRAQGAHVLLIPFHAHRTALGNPVNGMELAERLNCEAPEVSRCPILMPVSGVARAGAHLLLRSLTIRAPELARRIFVLDLDGEGGLTSTAATSRDVAEDIWDHIASHTADF